MDPIAGRYAYTIRFNIKKLLGSNENLTGSPYGQGAMSSQLQPGQQFQPSSGFGQQLMSQGNSYAQMQMQPQPTGYTAPYQNPMQTGYPGQQMQYNNQYTGYPDQQQQQQQLQQYPTGYGQQQMQMQPQPQAIGYQDVAQFDPYGPIGQGWGETQGQQPQGQQQSQSQQSNTTSYNGHLHPREYIRTHKAELETWDSFAWKQCLNGFDVLKDAWTARKKEAEGRIAIVKRDYGYTGQGEVERLQGIVKDADSKFGMLRLILVSFMSYLYSCYVFRFRSCVLIPDA